MGLQHGQAGGKPSNQYMAGLLTGLHAQLVLRATCPLAGCAASDISEGKATASMSGGAAVGLPDRVLG